MNSLYGRLRNAALLADDRATQIVEFAVSLPLLIVFAVGIFDFSSAFTLKQKLANAAREGARAAAAAPASDLGYSATPAAVSDAFQVVDNYLKNNNVNDCGIALSTSPTGLTWTSSVTSGACTITLIINRGYYFPASSSTASATCSSPGVANGAQAAIATCVNLQYGYTWRFSSIIQLFGSSNVPNTLTSTAVAFDEN